MEEKVIFHIDVNSAFLSWEAVSRLKNNRDDVDIRTIPSAVGGDQSKRHGIVLAKSIPAKAYGIKTGEPLVSAYRKCPNLMVVPTNFTVYQQYSKAFMDILREYSPDVEKYSIDEAFVDMTGTRRLFGEPEEVACKIKNRIRDELGFTVNIGISSNKLLAKMASDFKKPDMVHTLYRGEIEEKMWPLPIEELFFVGGATADKLRKFGIKTIGDLAKTDKELIRYHFKKHGEIIWNFANGIDTALVETAAEENKGYGNSTTIPFDVTDASEAKLVIMSLSETVAMRLRKADVKAEVISVSLKSDDFFRESHQMVLDAPTNITSEIYEYACKLFDELWEGKPIRLIGISTGKLKSRDEGRQLDLFSYDNYEKYEKLDAAVDKIRGKYGNDSIKRASFMADDRIEHIHTKK